jgi:hypothetical protein
LAVTVTHHQDSQTGAQTKDDKSFLLLGMIRVRIFNGALIGENRCGLRKSHSMFPLIGRGFLRIPNESQIVHDYIIITLYLFFNEYALPISVAFCRAEENAEAGLSGPTFVTMMKTTHFWELHHLALFRRLNIPGLRSIHV